VVQRSATDHGLGELLGRFAILEEKAARTADQVADLGRQAGQGAGGSAELRSELDALRNSVGRLTEVTQSGEHLDEVVALLAGIQDRLDRPDPTGALGAVPQQVEMLGATASDIRMRLDGLEGLTDAVALLEALHSGQAERDKQLGAERESIAGLVKGLADKVAATTAATTASIAAQASLSAELTQKLDAVAAFQAEQAEALAHALATVARDQSARIEQFNEGLAGWAEDIEAAAMAAGSSTTTAIAALDRRQAVLEEGLRFIATRLEALATRETPEVPDSGEAAADLAAKVGEILPAAMASSLAQLVQAHRADVEQLQFTAVETIRAAADETLQRAASNPSPVADLGPLTLAVQQAVASATESAIGRVGDAAEAAISRTAEAARATVASLVARDADLGLPGQRIEAPPDIVGRSLEVHDDGTRDRVAADVTKRLGRLREAAAGVSDAMRAEAHRRRNRRSG
jgi:chromosome segregation ATPase